MYKYLYYIGLIITIIALLVANTSSVHIYKYKTNKYSSDRIDKKYICILADDIDYIHNDIHNRYILEIIYTREYMCFRDKNIKYITPDAHTTPKPRSNIRSDNSNLWPYMHE